MQTLRKAGQTVVAKDSKRLAKAVTELTLRSYYTFKEETRDLGEVSVGTHPFSVLMRLYYSDTPQSVTDLSRFLRMQNPQLSKILNVLENRGLATRVHPESNRRRVDVELTARGRELIAEVFASLEKSLADALEDTELNDPRGVTSAIDTVYGAIFD